MTLKEQLAMLKGRLLALREGIEGGDEAAIEQGNQIKSEIEAVQAKIDAAERAKGLLELMGNQGGERDASSGAKTLGEHAVKELFGKVTRSQKGGAVSAEYKAAGDPHLTPSGAAGFLADYDRNIVTGVRRPLTIEELLGSESISGNALTYLVESSTVTGGAGTVAEGGAKPAVTFGDPTPVTEQLHKLAVRYKESDEILEDAAWMASSIDNRALYLFDIAKEDQLLNGNGTGTNITGLLNRSGVQTVSATAATLADKIFEALTKVQTGSGFTADALVINPADYQTLRLAKDSNLQYYGGGYFYAPYGSGNVAEQPGIWGLRTVVTTAIAQGTFLVGAFKAGASVINKGGVKVEIVNTNEDDFNKNLVSVRIEQRVALAVRYPAAFVKGTITTS